MEDPQSLADPRIIAAIVSAIVAAVIGVITFFFNLWRTQKELEYAERKVNEDLEIELVRQRIDVYEELMKNLIQLSSRDLEGISHEAQKEKVQDIVNTIQNNIFGKFGLISRHETREALLRLRAKCRKFLDDETFEISKVKKASWEVHQMLRSDLGVAQPNLSSAIENLRRNKIAGVEDEIENLLGKIHHNDWES